MQRTLSDIARILSLPTEIPKACGALHIMSLVFTALLTVFLIYLLKRVSIRGEKRLFLVMSCVLVAGELYKQFVLSFNGGGFSYDPYFLPMQFCSTPLYIYPLALIARNKRLYEGAVFYSATYCLLAGALVLIYPKSILCDSLAISIQSLIHHAVMVAVGIALLVKHFGRFTASGAVCGIAIFLSLLLVALGINLALGERVNMYYLNPASPVSVPVLSELSRLLPFPIVPILYAAVFTAVSVIVSGIPFRKKRRH